MNELLMKREYEMGREGGTEGGREGACSWSGRIAAAIAQASIPMYLSILFIGRQTDLQPAAEQQRWLGHVYLYILYIYLARRRRLPRCRATSSSHSVAAALIGPRMAVRPFNECGLSRREW
eukprot:GHVU01038563.1.p1 GENE.GHVU01038563.1~~GHVU01038563.1.p1  ORF type:complete len:121 (+),score=8.89 GHVU01038563.1:92-454(+)